VTVPTCYYLWPSGTSHADSGHHGGHVEHEEAHEEKEEEASQEEAPQEEEQPAEEPEQKEEPAQDTSKEQEESKESPETAKASGSEGEAQPMGSDANKASSKTEQGQAEQKETPDHKGSVEGVSFKGHMKEGSDGQDDNRKRETDSKGAYKKRIDSGLGKNLGSPETINDDPASQQVRNH